MSLSVYKVEFEQINIKHNDFASLLPLGTRSGHRVDPFPLLN